jgi:acyl-homoserine lactone acylase PvdQ
VTRGGERIPLPGGTNASGLLNIIGAPFSAAGGGYPNVSSGSSWIQATEFGADGPISRGIMTYSQSTNPNSPHFADQTKLFSQRQWVDLPFREVDVAAAATETTSLVEGKDACRNGGWQAFTNPSFANHGACIEHYDALREQRLAEIRERRNRGS